MPVAAPQVEAGNGDGPAAHALDDGTSGASEAEGGAGGNPEGLQQVSSSSGELRAGGAPAAAAPPAVAKLSQLIDAGWRRSRAAESPRAPRREPADAPEGAPLPSPAEAPEATPPPAPAGAGAPAAAGASAQVRRRT